MAENQPIPPAGGDDRPDLREVRREIAEAHALASRTHNAVASLAASLKEVVGGKSRLERALNLNSLVAYILFTVLLGGGFALLYRTRVDALQGDQIRAMRERDDAVAEAFSLRQAKEKRDEAARKAFDYYQLVRDGKREQAIARYHEIAGADLSQVEAQLFQDAHARARVDLVNQGEAAGLEAFRAEQWKRAAGELKLALTYEDEGPRAARMRYHFGVALHKQGDYQEAARQLELAIAGGAERTVGADARFFLAGALEMLRQLERARVEYLKFADGHPGHPLLGTARRKAAELADRTAKTP
jgi:TolA-binding protein